VTVLQTIERKIEGVFERGFRRAFRSSVQPVELARKLGREMEQNKTVSVSRVYVPNEFTVYLSPPDREHLSAFEGALTEELCTYLSAHASKGGYAMVAAPTVALQTDADLGVGEFGVACRVAEPPKPAVPAPRAATAAGPVSGTPAARDSSRPAGAPVAMPRPTPPAPAPAAAPATPPRPAPPAPAPAAANPGLRGVSGTQVISPQEAQHSGLRREAMTLVGTGGSHRISKRVTTMGRRRDCDLVVADPNVSRLHAEVRHVGTDYYLVDMGSTNGIEVNGKTVRRHPLADGDVVVMGTTELRVEVS